MKKIFVFFALGFLFLPSQIQAAETYQNCTLANRLPPPSYQSDADLCKSVSTGLYGKIPVSLSNCQSGLGDVCCCDKIASFSCSWREVVSKIEYIGTQATTKLSGGCSQTETRGEDCNPALKPSGTNYHCCCPAANTFKYEPAAWIMPELSVPINTVKFSQAKCDNPDKPAACEIPWIAEYIDGIYRYGLGIGGILAAIMLMAGGILWLISAGDASRITTAKSLIVGSITGLIILVGTYALLKQINPDLVTLNALALKSIERVNIEPDSEATTPVSLDMTGISKVIGVNCGQTSVAEIIKKSKGKTTYNNPDRGKTGPNGTVYNDCSGFASFILKCANGKSSGQNTASIFKDQQVWNGRIESLKPGDLIGWAPQNNKRGYGHVFIYMGGGLFGDCHGGEAGRRPGNCVSDNLSISDIEASAGRHSGGKLYFKQY